jgi:hypothetical protein
VEGCQLRFPVNSPGNTIKAKYRTIAYPKMHLAFFLPSHTSSLAYNHICKYPPALSNQLPTYYIDPAAAQASLSIGPHARILRTTSLTSA